MVSAPGDGAWIGYGALLLVMTGVAVRTHRFWRRRIEQPYPPFIRVVAAMGDAHDSILGLKKPILMSTDATKMAADDDEDDDDADYRFHLDPTLRDSLAVYVSKTLTATVSLLLMCILVDILTRLIPSRILTDKIVVPLLNLKPKSRRKLRLVIPGVIRLVVACWGWFVTLVRIGVAHGGDLFSVFVLGGSGVVGDSRFPGGGVALGSQRSTGGGANQLGDGGLRRAAARPVVRSHGGEQRYMGEMSDVRWTEEREQEEREEQERRRRAPDTGLDAMLGLGLKHGNLSGGMNRFEGRGRRLADDD